MINATTLSYPIDYKMHINSYLTTLTKLYSSGKKTE